MAWMLTFTRVMFPKTIPEAWWCVIESRTQHQIKELVWRHWLKFMLWDIFLKGYYTFKGDKRKNDWLALWASCSKNLLLLQEIWTLTPIQLIWCPSPLVWWKCFRRLANPILFLSVQSVFLSWCTGTLTTNAKNSTLHSPVKYVHLVVPLHPGLD